MIIHAFFTSDVREGDAPLTVQFTDLSTGIPDRWHWDFGDYGASDEQNPTHVYYHPGLYPVRLIIYKGTDIGILSIRDYIYVHSEDIGVATVDSAPPENRVRERTMYARGHATYTFVKTGVRVEKPDLYRS